jgi:glycogen debranching enzyme
MGAFVEAYLRVQSSNAGTRRVARERFLAPLWRHADEAGVGHVSEIADGEAPHTPRGCPFQAWSMGELLRLEYVLLAEDQTVAQTAVQTAAQTAARDAHRIGEQLAAAATATSNAGDP